MAIIPTNIQFNEPTHGKTTWPKGFLVLTVLLLILVIGSVVIVKSLEGKALTSMTRLDEEIAKQKEELSLATSKEVVNFQNELLNLKTILKDHVVFSDAINMIAENTHQKVRFINLKINYTDKQIEINGIGESNSIIAQAGYAFSELLGVVNVNFKNVKTSTDGIHFLMTLDVLESFFKK